MKLKKVKTFGEWVAIAAVSPKTTIEVTGTQFRNEGVVVGVGDGVDLSAIPVRLGDKVLVRTGSGFKIDLAGGMYASIELVILHARDILAEIPKMPDEQYEIVDNV